jgi:hypothetical protein
MMQGNVDVPDLHGIVPRAVRHLGEGISKDESGEAVHKPDREPMKQIIIILTAK